MRRYDRQKLAPHQVLEIRDLLAEGTTQAEIARQYGVSRQVIHLVAQHKTWRNLDGEAAATAKSGERARYHGVIPVDRQRVYVASVQHDGRRHHLGTFSDPETAARAHDAKARELGMPPERLNFPEERPESSRLTPYAPMGQLRTDEA